MPLKENSYLCATNRLVCTFNIVFMNPTKELILQKSFALFLKKGYDGVSMDDIQTQIGLSRGAIYHHFKSKEQIYKEVIDNYLLSSLTVFLDIAGTNPSTLLRAIEENLTQRKIFIQKLRKITAHKIDDFFYFKLAFQADEYYKGFSQKITLLNSKEFERWKAAVLHAIETGEIRKNLDADYVAQMFVMIPQGLGLAAAFNSRLKAEDLKEAYLKFYNIIKTEPETKPLS